MRETKELIEVLDIFHDLCVDEWGSGSKEYKDFSSKLTEIKGILEQQAHFNKIMGGKEGEVPPDQPTVKYEKIKTLRTLVDRLFIIGFNYGIDAERYSLKENTEREDKAKAEIRSLLQGKG